MDPDGPIELPPLLDTDLGTDLLATYWPSVIALLLCASCVLFAVRAAKRTSRSRRARVFRTTAWAVPGALLVVISLGLGVNTWVGYFPSVTSLQRWFDDQARDPVTVFPNTAVDASQGTDAPDGGERLTSDDHGYAFLATVPSTAGGVPDAGAWIYLPPGYDAEGNTERYPVIYALHGAPGSAADWFAGGRIDYLLDVLITRGSLPPVIVVSPDLNAGPERIDAEPLNRPGGPQIEDFVVEDVVSWADERLRTRPDAAHRVIAGMSSGGLGSLMYGLHSPATFGGVVSIMPYLTPYTPEIVKDEGAFLRNSPLEVIATRTGATDQKVFLGQGDGEAATEATRIRDALRAQGQTTTLRVLPGLDHNWTAARTIMPYGLVWVAQQLEWLSP
ncbi:alpha/beta hydrolase-fold protein [Okibacterium endophyticum]